MANKTITIDLNTQVYNGITLERIEDERPRRHHLWLSELRKEYSEGDMIDPHFCALVKRALLAHDHVQGAKALPKQTTVYRVALHPDRPDIEVVSIGMERVDMEPDRVYANFSQLPKWMQDKLHVMLMLNDTAPTEHIEGLGRRISKYVFWLEIPTKENGNG